MPDKIGSCSRCGADLQMFALFADTSRRRNDFPHYEDALIIDIHGGYGMYLDENATRLIICKECADIFFNENQWARRFISLYAGNI